jgi:hypothetical protein
MLTKLLKGDGVRAVIISERNQVAQGDTVILHCHWLSLAVLP